MIVYIDSSALIRSYLPDEPDHNDVRALLDDVKTATISGSWTRIEVTGALVRAARSNRVRAERVLELFHRDTAPSNGPLLLVDALQADIEGLALQMVRSSGIRSMDAGHLACASIAFDNLAEPGEERGFATRDAEQAAVAKELGYTIV